MNYNEIKKLDEDSLKNMKEGIGPTDECICNLLAPPDNERKSFSSSIKKAFASLSTKKDKKRRGQRGDLPIVFSNEGGGLHTTKETVKRKSSCGKCGCDATDNIVLKHSYASIRITSPDVSTICPCPTDCLPAKDKLLNNIKVTVERMNFEPILDPDTENSEASLQGHREKTLLEPVLTDKKSLSSLINAQYENVAENIFDR